MNIMQCIEILEQIRKRDKKFFNKKIQEKAFATWCAECGENNFAGYSPFWHIYRRKLCRVCGKEYENFLKQLGAWNI